MQVQEGQGRWEYIHLHAVGQNQVSVVFPDALDKEEAGAFEGFIMGVRGEWRGSHHDLSVCQGIWPAHPVAQQQGLYAGNAGLFRPVGGRDAVTIDWNTMAKEASVASQQLLQSAVRGEFAVQQ